MNVPTGSLPTGFVVVLVVLGLVQLTLDVVALVDLARRPVDRVALGSKWVWVAIVLLVNLLGAILYLTVGRKPAPVTDVPSPGPASLRPGDVADSLYGPRDATAGPAAEQGPGVDGPRPGGTGGAEPR